jgi:hypothetical protein
VALFVGVIDGDSSACRKCDDLLLLIFDI